ncbi:MAG: hypothetical protein JWQ71_3579 [Pedosphaera sp.]|nr:hypothetical protein [Pedosphaera sp.]
MARFHHGLERYEKILQLLVPSSLFAALAFPSLLFGQGSLTPPGAPAATMKTLDQVEARIPVDAAHTPGDAANQFIINQPGSYYLTTNITGVSSKAGINIVANDVTLDLNGFVLTGVAGATKGIVAGSFNASRTNIIIRHGLLRGWPGGAVDANYTYYCELERVNAFNCPNATGLAVGWFGSIRHCTASGNGVSGITTGDTSLVNDSIASSNKFNGIVVGGDCVIRGCTVTYNANGPGINSFGNATISDCIANNNTLGIQAAANTVIRDCVANNNTSSGIYTLDECKVTGCSMLNNDMHGIQVGARGAIRDCTANFNRTNGISGTDQCTVTGCTANANGNGVAGHGINLGVRGTVRQCIASQNQASGIFVSGDSVVVENHASSNGLGNGASAAGIRTISGSSSRIEGNQVRDNAGTGILASSSDLVFRNSSGGNTVNYSPTSGANFAPIQSLSTATNALGNFVF